MITAEALNEMMAYKAPTLTMLAKDNGYKGPAFSSCRFLGITNGGQLCFMAVYLCEGGTDSTKVYLRRTGSRVIAEVDRTEVWSYN
jgi:hypothetical protein